MEKYAAILTTVIQTPLVDNTECKPLPLVRTTRPREVRVVEQGDWPTSTKVLCWHCCHPFSGPPLPLPVSYDSKRQTFRVTGTFCSWACIKGYNSESRSYMSQIDATIISLFYKQCTGTMPGLGKARVMPAPPRIALKAFGGSMTLEEFRKCDKNMVIVPPRVILHRPVIEEVPARLRERPTEQHLQEEVSFQSATSPNPQLRIKRSKPLLCHNLLGKTMGVQIR